MKNSTIFGTHFCGKKISNYGLENGRVDYATLASAFDAVLCNNIFSVVDDLEAVQGDEYYEDSDGNVYGYDEAQERIEELEEEREALEDERDGIVGDLDESEVDEANRPRLAEIYARLTEIDTDLEALEAPEGYRDPYQWYIISDNGAKLLEDYTDEVLYYSDSLDCYVWGVCHYGTSWDYVLTSIPCDSSKEY